MSSAIPAARLKLYDLLAANSGLVGVQVTFGPPLVHEENEVVAILAVQDPTEEEIELGANATRQFFTQEVAVKAHDPTASSHADITALDARGFALADVVRDVVHGVGRTDYRTLEGTVEMASVIGMPTDGVMPVEIDGNHHGWAIVIRVLVRCQARLT